MHLSFFLLTLFPLYFTFFLAPAAYFSSTYSFSFCLFSKKVKKKKEEKLVKKTKREKEDYHETKSFIEQRGTRTPNVIDNWITARLLTNQDIYSIYLGASFFLFFSPKKREKRQSNEDQTDKRIYNTPKKFRTSSSETSIPRSDQLSYRGCR